MVKLSLTGVLVYWAVQSLLAVRIENNGYEDILIGISQEVTEDHTLVDAIQELLINSSALLYVATRQRAYYRDVKILIPPLWSSIKVDARVDRVFQESQVRIGPSGKNFQGDNSYTLQTRGCGEPGEYIQMSSSFILDSRKRINEECGDPAKVFVHEWAHLRYGVFDEHGIAGDKTFPIFYQKNYYTHRGVEARVNWNVCSSRDVQGNAKDKYTGAECKIEPSRGIPGENCTFYPDENNQVNISLMSLSFIDSVRMFCDETLDNGHVPEAPNKHNAICDGKSTWAVISNHEDFSNGRNLPRSISSTRPSFSIIQTKNARFVVVLDMSTSMEDEDKIGRSRAALQRWIKYQLPERTELGIVVFSELAEVLVPLTEINADTRLSLSKSLPKRTVHSSVTCIGCGLNEARKMLVRGGMVVLITDGMENERPYVSEVTNEYVHSNSRVLAITFTDEPHSNIENLTAVTNGRMFYVRNAQDLFTAFSASKNYMLQDPDIMLFVKEYSDSGIHTDEFYVDHDTMDNLEIQITYSRRSFIRDMYVLSPFWKGGNMFLPSWDSEDGLAIIRPDISEVGEWAFRVDLVEQTGHDYVLVTVSRNPKSLNHSQPIRASCWTSANSIDPKKTRLIIFARVTSGEDPVYACKVWATIMRPDGSKVNLELRDNGSGADITRNDGIYSRYFTYFTSKGIYFVDCSARKNRPSFFDRLSVGSRMLPNYSSEGSVMDKDKKIEHFIRRAFAGHFETTRDVEALSDLFPPSRITDLTVTVVPSVQEGNTSKINFTLKLQWIAAGDDLDNGEVSSCILKMSTDFYRLRMFFDSHPNLTIISEDDLLDGSLQPLRSGEHQMVVLNAEALGLRAHTLYFFGMKSVDDGGKQSGLSNVPSIVIIPSSFATVAEEYSGHFSLGLVIGLAVLGLVILAAIAMCGRIYYHRRKKRKRKPYWRR